MDLLDIVHRSVVPEPWAEGEKIPWNEPGFSARMLKEHLSQAHDAASRRVETIDRQVEWIHHVVLSDKPTKILDLGCGPGSYTQRLAKLGHACTGVDFSPASIAYARQTAGAEQLQIEYLEADIRQAEIGEGYGLAMLIFGEFNVFRRTDAELILNNARRALAKNGRLLLEAHTFAAVRAIGKQPLSWYASKGGLFSAAPHLCLTENSWDPVQNITTQRYFIVDATDSTVERFASSMQAYTEAQYTDLLHICGFGRVEIYQSLIGTAQESQADFLVILCQKQ